MDDLKLKVGIARFPYGGNGMSQSEHPDVSDWIMETVDSIKSDDRIELAGGKVPVMRFADTPITMTRNRAVVCAREMGLDVLVMIDSDMKPDSRYGDDKTAKKFWDSSFDFIYNGWSEGRYYVVGAPYCGGGDSQNPFIYKWGNSNNREYDESRFSLEMYSREEAAEWSGIVPCAALSTGLIAFSMPVFSLTDPTLKTEQYIQEVVRRYQEKEISAQEFSGAMQETSWFYYEYRNHFQEEKSSPEDVTATRDISLSGQKEWGYNPTMCNFDSWSGHWKPELVDKPLSLSPESISNKLVDVAIRRMPSAGKRVYVHGNISDQDAGNEGREKLQISVGVPDSSGYPDREELQKKIQAPESDGKKSTEPATADVSAKPEKEERRIDTDSLSTPPISDYIAGDLSRCVQQVVHNQNGHELNCMVLGSYTANWASIISDSFGAAGGRVLCIGDCLDPSGKPDESWLSVVGDRFRSTVHPVSGDIDESFQGIDRFIDLVMFSTCGEYAQMASLVSKWAGLIKPGGVICGSQFDLGGYGATSKAITDIFGNRVKQYTNDGTSSFWFVEIEPVGAMA